MPRYFLNLISSYESLRDDEGVDAPDLEQARLAALQNFRGLLSHEALEREFDLRTI